MKVLITAFKPFNKSTNNYSYEVLQKIDNVDKMILDVCYDKCYSDLANYYDLEQYDLIIALGEARSRNEIMLEVAAKNISSCSLPDNLGIIKKDEKIIIDGPVSLETKVNVDLVKDIISFSYDAGKYVCNNLYYHLLSNYPNKSIFIHIPHCHDNEDEYYKYAEVIMNIIDKIKMH